MTCGTAMGLLFFLGLALALAADQTGTVYYQGGKFNVKFGVLDPTGVAWGTFQDTLNVSGWGVLEMKTNRNYADADQMYAAGLLEGSLTPERIAQAYVNMYIDWPDGSTSPPDIIVDWFNKNHQWIQKKVSENPDDSLWRFVNYLYRQLDGLYDGYSQMQFGTSLPQLTHLDIELLSANPDALSIYASLVPSARPDWASMSNQEFQDAKAKWGFEKCSAVVKLTSDFSDLLMGHSTWMIYSFMNRIYKMYYFDLQDPAIRAKGHSHSSYPGVLASLDDYYMADSGIGVVQTTNGMYNNSLYDAVTTEVLLTWTRMRAAQALASGGQQWSEILSRHYSGTYTNQYVVVDFSKFTPEQPLQDGTLYVVEEMPTIFEYADVTHYLGRGHWPSYNVPFFPSVYEASDYPQIVKLFGASESYDLAPRATIFRRDITNVTDFDSFKYLMRYNNWQTDPLSNGNPSWAVMARGDLDPTKPSAFGGYDTKVTNFERMKSLVCDAINGPTTQGQVPFSWKNSPFASEPHEGQPDTFNFDFVTMQPTLF